MMHDAFGDSAALDALFHPKTVAVVGPTADPDTLGHRTLATLAAGGFEGSIVAVDSRHHGVRSEVPVYRALEDVPAPVDLAVVVTSSHELADAIEQCARARVKGVVVPSAPEAAAARRLDIERDVRERLRRSRIKMIGPGCCALMNPSLGLNVSAGLPMPVAGKVAFLTQSGSLSTAILDWSHKGIVGFSAFVSLCSPIDVGWANLIDYFGGDWATRAILIHMESIANMRSFLSAARAVALQKPIIVIKAGRTEAAARAFAWHPGCQVSDDEVLDAALRRVGVIRVNSVGDLFHVADALSKQPRPKGPRLTIVTNAGGVGVLAADRVAGAGILVPQKDDPADGSVHSSSGGRDLPPLDVLGDGSSEPFLAAVDKAARDPASDGVLLVLVPQSMADPSRALEGLRAMEMHGKPALLCVPGVPAIPMEQEILSRACLPMFPAIGAAARTFNYMWRYTYDLEAIYETPELHADAADRYLRQQAGELILGARRARRDSLSDAESRQVLALYGIHAHPMDDGPPRDDGRPRKDAFTTRDTGRYELQIGSRVDPEFGPVLWLGAGGRLGDLLDDRVMGLPPLNATLARRMLERSTLFPGLHRLASRGEVNLPAIEAALVCLSHLVVEQPAIREVSVNPLLASPEGALAVAAHITLLGSEHEDRASPGPVFRPFPVQYVSAWITKRGQPVMIRPIRAEDEPLMVDFHGRLSESAVYMRYFQVLKLARRTAHETLIRVCFVDYDREMVLVAEQRGTLPSDRQILAIASLTKSSRRNHAEVAVLVRDDYQRHGLGTELVRRLVDVARDEHLDRVTASTMTDNPGMCAIFGRLGFTLSIGGQDVEAMLDLAQP